ncbi:MAG: hypothetical protein HY055_16860 [Magnetospirillum sp.]|nr:hypothetical protein [Magnetospirillum sp.]
MAPLVKVRGLGYSSGMSDAPPDFKALARRYLDLWQEQVAAVAADPALAEAVARGVAMMTQSAAAVAQATGLKVNHPQGGPKADERTDSPNSSEAGPNSSEAGKDGPAPAAAAPHDPRLDPDEFARRLAALEGRVAELEAALGRGGEQPQPKPRRKRT